MGTLAARRDPFTAARTGAPRRGVAALAALGLPIATLALRLVLWDLAPGLPYIAFVPAVMVAAAYGGIGPGVVAALVSALLGTAFLAPSEGLWPSDPQTRTGLGLFGLASLVIVAGAHAIRRERARLSRAEAAEAAERERALLARATAAEAEAARWRTERELEAMTDALPVFIAHVGADLTYRFVNQAYVEWFGRSRQDIVGRTVADVIGPQAAEAVRPHIEAVMAGRRVGFEQTIPYASTEHRRMRADYVPAFDGDGAPAGFYALVQDVTEVRLQSDRLAANERRMRAILESALDSFYAMDGDWRITLINRTAEQHFGRTQEAVLGRTVWEAFPELVGSPFETRFRQVMASRVACSFEERSAVRPNRILEMRVAPKEDSGIIVSFNDITERRRAEEHRELLVNELNHRVKNTLAVVQSMAAQSFRDPRVPPEARQGFEGRLMALSAAHNILTTESWVSAPLERVAENALGPFGGPQRFAVQGPSIRLTPAAAVSLALGLHELATNAAKYGALLTEAGRVAVEWTVTEENGEAVFRLLWSETGGPPVSPPTRRGFGSRLIERGLAAELDGRVEVRYRPEGVVCLIEAALSHLEAP